MKTAVTLIHLAALSACFTVSLAASGELRMPGVRRALQTIDATAAQVIQPERPALPWSSR